MKKYFFLLALFHLFCFHQFRLFAQENKPKNIILLVVPGFGYGHFSIINEEMKGNSAFVKLEKTGIIRPSPEVIKSPASTSILATGFVSSSKSSGFDEKGNKVETLLEMAAISKRAVGIISSASITFPVNAVFYTHQKNLNNEEQIAAELFDLKPELVIAAGINKFKERTDNRDLILEFRKEGYKIIDEKKDFEKGSQLKTIVLFSSEHLEKAPLRGDFYVKAFQKAFKTLVKNDKGYFMLITFPQLEWACQENNPDHLKAELTDLNQLIEKILLFAKNDSETLLLIVSEKESGGVSIVNEGKNNIKFSAKSSTPMLVPVFANGPGSENFSSFFQINEFFLKLGNLIIR